MKIVVFRDIEPMDPKTCDGRCPWRSGHQCDLFFTTLVPLDGGPDESRCRRSRDCKRAERQSKEIERKITAEREMRMEKHAGQRVAEPLMMGGRSR